VEERGHEALHRALAAVDPEAAARLRPRDFVRVSRALEIYELSGRPQSAWHAEHQFREHRHRYRMVGARRERADLDQRIRARTRLWIAQGWIDEVAGLIATGFRDARAMGSVGYRQVLDRIEGRLAPGALEDAVVRATRIFARRQRTWLRDATEICWVDADAPAVGSGSGTDTSHGA
jgi:tRNA dimethylallyltransferase